MANKQGSISLSVRIGIHLQPVRLENDFNKQSNIIGAGINVAKQVMQKAKPNEALVSRSYHENVPTTTQASSTLLDDLEVKFENHVLDYQAYLSDLNEKQVTKQVINSEPVTLNQPATSTPIQPSLKKPKYPNASSWRYVLACLFVPLALFSIVKLTVEPAKAPPLKASQPVIIKTQPAIPEIQLEKTDDNDYETDSNLMQEELIPVIPLEDATDKKTLVNKSTVEKEVKQKPKSKVDSTPQNSKIKELLSWESLKNSIKQGQKNECTQSEIALNQCRE